MRVKVVDSHTGGEPTRVVIDGGPELGNGSMAERLDHTLRLSRFLTELADAGRAARKRVRS